MEKVWVNEYEAGIPAEIDPDKFSSLNSFYDEKFTKFAHLPAFKNMGVTYTFNELKTKAYDFAAYLQHIGVSKGDRIAIMMPNLLQYPVALIGIHLAGAIVVNVNPLYTDDELKHQLNDSGAVGIVVLENFAVTLGQIVRETSVAHTIIARIADVYSPPKSWLVDFVVKHIKKMVPAYDLPSFTFFNAALKAGAKVKEKFVKPEVEGNDIAFLQYTGGTTGRAKGAILTHRNMIANLQQARTWLKNTITDGEEAVVTALPLYHIFSLTANCLTFMCIGSLNILVTNPRDIPAFVKLLDEEYFTAITGVNTLFNALLNSKGFNKVDFSGLKVTIGGGMAVQQSVAERWQDITGRPLVEAYGLTETSPAVCINPMNLKEYNGAIGLPLPSTEIMILDDDDNELDFDEPGELLVRGPQVMRGYWNQPEETSNVLSADGWLRTGDVALVDRNGYVRIVDRKKDMIIVSGFNVYPNEVEDVIAKLAGVLEVAVVGVPDEVRGELVKAYIVRSNDNLSESDIIDHCRESLVAYKVPKIVEFKSELPKTNVGKILRRALKE